MIQPLHGIHLISTEEPKHHDQAYPCSSFFFPASQYERHPWPREPLLYSSEMTEHLRVGKVFCPCKPGFAVPIEIRLNVHFDEYPRQGECSLSFWYLHASYSVWKSRVCEFFAGVVAFCCRDEPPKTYRNNITEMMTLFALCSFWIGNCKLRINLRTNYSFSGQFYTNNCILFLFYIITTIIFYESYQWWSKN